MDLLLEDPAFMTLWTTKQTVAAIIAIAITVPAIMPPIGSVEAALGVEVCDFRFANEGIPTLEDIEGLAPDGVECDPEVGSDRLLGIVEV